MSKMTTLLSIMGGLTLLFYLFGIIQDTPNSTLLDLLLNPENVQRTDWIQLIILGIASLAISAVSTFVSRSINSDFWLMVPYVTVLFTFGWDAIAIYQALAAVNKVVALMIFGPYMVLFINAVVEWWRGVAP